MAWPRITISPPHMTREGSEIVLLGLIAGGVIWLLGKAIDKIDVATGAGALDVAAFLLVLQAIINAIKDRWTQRGTDTAIQTMATMQPPSDSNPLGSGPAPTGKPGDPVHTQEEKPGAPGQIG